MHTLNFNKIHKMSTSASIIIPTKIGVSNTDRLHITVKAAYVSYIQSDGGLSTLGTDLRFYDTNEIVISYLIGSDKLTYRPNKCTLHTKFLKEKSIHTGEHPSFSPETWGQSLEFTNLNYLYYKGQWYVSGASIALEYDLNEGAINALEERKLYVRDFFVFNGTAFYEVWAVQRILTDNKINF